MSILTSVCVYLHPNVPLCRSAVSPQLGFTALANYPCCLLPCLHDAHFRRASLLACPWKREPEHKSPHRYPLTLARLRPRQAGRSIACLVTSSSASARAESPARSSTILPLRLSTTRPSCSRVGESLRPTQNTSLATHSRRTPSRIPAS